MKPIIIATIMRPTGETGVQTHFNCFSSYLNENRLSNELVTPFSYFKFLVYPVFAVRAILHKLSGTASLWWYRYWHQFFLRLALKQKLHAGTECIIYAQCPLSAAAALSARFSATQRVVMVTHFNISQADEWVGKGVISLGGQLYQSIRAFEEEVLPKLDGIVYVSGFMQDELLMRMPALKAIKSCIVPNFLPDPGFVAEPPKVADLISIGSLESRKNQRYLLDIIAALRDLGKPRRLTVIGDGPDRQMLENSAQTLGINDLVTFLGFVKNAAEQIVSHKACIHVATIENLPVTLIEAMARSRPIFAAPVGGIPDLLAGEQVGLALPLDDAVAAARIVADAMENEAWMAVAGASARTRFLEVYANDVSAKRLVEFLESITVADV